MLARGIFRHFTLAVHRHDVRIVAADAKARRRMEVRALALDASDGDLTCRPRIVPADSRTECDVAIRIAHDAELIAVILQFKIAAQDSLDLVERHAALEFDRDIPAPLRTRIEKHCLGIGHRMRTCDATRKDAACEHQSTGKKEPEHIFHFPHLLLVFQKFSSRLPSLASYYILYYRSVSL